MRWAARAAAAWLLSTLAIGLPWPAQAQPAGSGQPVLLRDALGTIDAQPLARVWLDANGEATVDQVAAADRSQFRPAERDTIYRLGPKSALWLRLELQRGRDGRQDWGLEFPIPVLDQVTLYQREDGRWRAESAGDTLAVATWPEGGRYPFFRIDVAPGETREVFARIRHTSPANFPMRLTTAASHAQHQQMEYLALGTAFGALLLLLAACMALSWVYRDRIYAWYAVYAVLTSLAVAAFTGAAAHLLWPRFGALGDAPMSMLGAAAGAAAMLFVRSLLGLRRRFPVQDKLTLVLAGLGAVLVVLAPFLPKLLQLHLLGAYMAVMTLSIVGIGAAAWRRGDVVGTWVVAAYLPMTASVLATFSRIFGWVPISFGSQYAVVAAMVLQVPLLLVALSIRSRDRHSAEIRAHALSTHDALTGLLAPHLFQDRLRQVITRFKREGDGAAVMYIQLVNHARIREMFGASVAEQSLLRSVIKLRRLLRDVDTVSRVDEARFAVILEGASTRPSVTERAARLIAAGLMPLPGLKPDVTLQFHVAALLLSERLLEAEEVEQALAGQLARMSPRTRRPIRFIVAEAPQDGDTGMESSLFLGDGHSRPPLAAVR